MEAVKNNASLPGVPSEADLKKAARKARQDYDLHVGLIMRTMALNIAAARVQAYLEGVAGLAKRLDK